MLAWLLWRPWAALRASTVHLNYSWEARPDQPTGSLPHIPTQAGGVPHRAAAEPLPHLAMQGLGLLPPQAPDFPLPRMGVSETC